MLQEALKAGLMLILQPRIKQTGESYVMHDKIKILDIEKKTNTFTVTFEVPGKHYDQSYPKRLKHSFPLEPHLLEKNSSGDYEFEKSLKKNYLKDDDTREKEKKVEEKLGSVRNDVKDKKHTS